MWQILRSNGFFYAIGIFINDCGLTNIFSEVEILASGSVNGFVAGKHYRCKRIHPMAALGLQILYLLLLLNEAEVTNDQIINSELQPILSDYFKCKALTVEEKHGKRHYTTWRT